MDGPLITLEFATIEGIRIGFGYNSIVRSPTIDELSTFPFIDDGSVAGAGNNPLAILRNMQTWISVKDTSYWGAVGLKVTAFDILAVTAVALLQFSDLGCDIAIFGNAIAQMPAAVSPNETIVYIEVCLPFSKSDLRAPLILSCVLGSLRLINISTAGFCY